MKSKILFIILTISTSLLYATKHEHIDKNEIRYYNASPLDVTIQQKLRDGNVWQAFLTDNPNWFVMFDENNKQPHKAFGEPIQLTGSSNTDVLNFFSNTTFTLPSDLRFVTNSKNDKYINFDFNQFYNNIEVISSKVYAKLSLDNKLIAFGLDIYNDINIDINPIINENTAISAAQQQINQPITDVSIKKKLMILPIPNNGKYEYHLVYVVKFKTRIEEGPAHYTCYVDAKDATLLMRKNEVMYEAPPAVSSVSGELYTTHPYNPSSVEKLKHLKANNPATGTNYYTDAFGNVNIPLGIGTQIRYKLEGLYSDVQTNGNTPDIYAALSASNTISFDNSNSTIQERTAYWAVNEVHDHMKLVFPTFTGLDFSLETNVDEFGTCNAFFAGTSINFYEEGLSTNGTDYCEATGKIVDVVYHEYGHAINSYRYNGGSGMQNGALNEGFADVWAFTITEDPILGIGFYQNNPTGYVRRFDINKKVYPQDLVGEVHADGEIIAGAFWDTYLNLGDMQQTIDLFKYLYDNGPDGANGNEGVIFTDVLLEVLYADDNDANLTNGTPNDIAIVSAFALHGITLISNAVISHTPVYESNSNVFVPISATVSMSYPWALASANCYFRINNGQNWAMLPMLITGSSMQVSLPAQNQGTIISYYLSLTDIYGFESATTPIAANITPLENANPPNYIMVGYQLAEEEDFDVNLGFWQTGISGDNASTGLWTIDTPIPSYGTPGNLATIVQTGSQHTQGGSNCAFTGNALATDGIGANDVDGGHTSLVSPYYNLTAYSNPAFSYWRWYTNSPLSGANPGADWWQVLITNDGVNWHYVENNISSDISWRKVAFRVKDYVSLTNSVQLKFIASDSLHIGQNLDGGSLVEAAVDDVYLFEEKTSVSAFNDLLAVKPKLIKITDILGKEVDLELIIEKTTLFYIYDDGSVEKKIMLD